MNARARIVVFIVAVAVMAATFAVAMRSSETGAARTRSFVFTYQVHVPAGTANQHLWIPLPQSDEHQSISHLALQSPVAHKEGTETEYGNRFAVFSPTAAEIASGYDVTLQFQVTRKEYARSLSAVNAGGATVQQASLARYLEPDKLVPLNATIAELARQQTEGATDPLEKARRVYTYVASTMRYDKSGEGWGRGDEMWACTSKRGNCTDFHSVLIGMLRSSGIPARFEIGFPLPEGKSEGNIPGYHCWAEFYVKGTGWIPVDASEASKNPAKRDYFFGAVDADRVLFTYGRDLRLSNEQKGAPLNYFIYPYAEADGQPVTGLVTHFSFKDLAPAAAAD